MKTILFNIIFILSCFTMTSCAKCTKDCTDCNDTIAQVHQDTIDLNAQRQHLRDSLMSYLTCDYGDFNDEICTISSNEFKGETHNGLNIDPMLIQSVSEGNDIMPIVIVNYVGKTLIGVNTANLMADSVQYTMPYLDTINVDGSGKQKYEIHMLALSLECVNAIPNANHITIAVWGDGGAAKYDLTDKEVLGLKTLIEYFDTYRIDK